MRRYRRYTDEDIIKYAQETKSMSGLLKLLGLKPVGGNFINLKKNLQRLQLECPHWTGQGWNKGAQLKDWSDYTKIEPLKKHLLKLKDKCERCNNNEWMGQPLTLEVHHINGDRSINELTNLMILCPNCHSQTKNFRNKKQI